MHILIASDGSEHAREAALYVAPFAKAAEAEVTLLGVVEGQMREEAFQHTLETLRKELEDSCDCRVTTRIRRGFVDDQILAETNEHFYHLAVIGSRGRHRLRLFAIGSTAQRLARHIKVPLLIVPPGHREIRRVLICTSGEKPGEVDAAVGGALAALVGAEVTALHVMSQIPISPRAKLDDLERDISALIESGAREGRHLQRIMDILSSRGVRREWRRAKIRRGLVLDEILSEAREGNYDLIVIGAHQVPPDKPWREVRQLLQEDIAAQILKHTRLPVLVVRALDETQWTIPTTPETNTHTEQQAGQS
jgi:nucleotide-binding universal stress UspA family protein